MADGMEARVDLLYNPELLTLEIGPNKRIFKVPRGLVCSLSKYFAKAFTDSFAEGQARTITLEDAEEWHFECFIGWMYTKRLFWQPEGGALRSSQKSQPDTLDTPKDIKEPDEDDPNDPVTWPYDDLFDLYIFGDYFDSKGFRGVVMDAFQTKVLMNKPRQYLMPPFSEYAKIFTSLPETSPLHKFCLDLLVFWQRAPGASELWPLEDVPTQTLLQLFSLSRQVTFTKCCKACMAGVACEDRTHPDVKRVNGDYYYDLCASHEHETREEKVECRKKWASLEEKHDLDVDESQFTPAAIRMIGH